MHISIIYYFKTFISKYLHTLMPSYIYCWYNSILGTCFNYVFKHTISSLIYVQRDYEKNYKSFLHDSRQYIHLPSLSLSSSLVPVTTKIHTMSPILKCLLGLLIVMCFVQVSKVESAFYFNPSLIFLHNLISFKFIEMAPVINDPLDIDWNKFFKESANRLKNNLNAEKFKVSKR